VKLKPFVHRSPGKISFGTTLVDDEPRADMFLPAWFVIMGLLLCIFGTIGVIVFLVLPISVPMLMLTAVTVLLGVAVLLCWKNQTIHMLPNDAFEYSTFLGKKKIYRFCDIKTVKKSTSSTTLYVADGKVYIDALAIVTDRLSDRLRKQLEVLNCNAEND